MRPEPSLKHCAAVIHAAAEEIGRRPVQERKMTIARMLGLAVIMAACLQLAACASYRGTVTNAPQPAGAAGPPLLTNGYAP